MAEFYSVSGSWYFSCSLSHYQELLGHLNRAERLLMFFMTAVLSVNSDFFFSFFFFLTALDKIVQSRRLFNPPIYGSYSDVNDITAAAGGGAHHQSSSCDLGPRGAPVGAA